MSENISDKTKVLIGIVAAAAALGGIYWWMFGGQSILAPSSVQNGASMNQAGTMGSTQLTNGNSNADLNQDLQTIDAQSSVFTSDSASMNQSLNDQPVTQSQP